MKTVNIFVHVYWIGMGVYTLSKLGVLVFACYKGESLYCRLLIKKEGHLVLLE